MSLLGVGLYGSQNGRLQNSSETQNICNPNMKSKATNTTHTFRETRSNLSSQKVTAAFSKLRLVSRIMGCEMRIT